MKRVIAKLQLILLFSCVVFRAHTLAETPEEVRNAFIAYRQRQREARLLDRTSPNIQSRPRINLESSNHSYNDAIVSGPNWAGAVQQSPPSGTFNRVQAQWVLPTVGRPPSASGAGVWTTALWVGIDGTSSCHTAILQAGTTSYLQVDSSGGVTTGASVWYEWYPENLMYLTTLAVAAGDTVEVIVIATSLSQGTVTVNNLSTGGTGTVSLSSPDPSGNLCGATAEWIVEDIGSDGSYVPFAEFSAVNFQNCVASTTTGATTDLTDTSLSQIVQNNVVLATPSVLSSSDLQVTYG